MYNSSDVIQKERRSVFLVNFILVLLVILSFLFHFSLSYFFYFNVILTMILSYFFFIRSKSLSKTLILTNMFILFYFLYPSISSFLYELIGSKSYIFIMFYNVLVAYIFVFFSGHSKDFLGDFKNFNFKVFGIVVLIGFLFGFFFWAIKEPVPRDFVMGENILDILWTISIGSFIVALSEQMIFQGFLYNTYKKITTKRDAFYQVAIIFVMFHLLRFENLVKFYFTNFQEFFILFLIAYYIFLFIFMLVALYLYTFKGKKYSGNFLYPLTLHFVADFTLFFLYAL